MNTADYFQLIEDDLRVAHQRDRVRRRQRLQAAGALGCTLLALLVALSPSGEDERGSGLSAALGVASARAAELPNPFRSGVEVDSLSLVTVARPGGPYSALSASRRTTELLADGSGRLRIQTIGQPRFLGARDRQRWEADGRPKLSAAGVTAVTLPARDLRTSTLGPVADLPTDPTQLRGRLQTAAARSTDPNAEALQLAADLLAQPAVPPAVRSAVFAALDGLPGIERAEAATDSTGRPGVALSVTSTASGAEVTQTLLFDPRSTQPISVEQRLDQQVAWLDAPAGTVIEAKRFSARP